MFKKLMSAFAVLLLIGVLITGLLSMEIVSVYYFKGVEDRLTTNAKLIQTAIEQDARNSQQQYEELCRRYGEITGSRVTIIGLDGNVLGDSDADAQDMENHSDRPEVKQALGEEFGKSVRKSKTLDKEMLYIALPLKGGRDDAGIIRAALPLDDISVIQ
ncbi:MAG TPA: PAS domain-containing sensor histidine kinase, partial [Bacillota bacterium]|nr:PAS domain-containing sensor histidine kinase [Bacillota bacterium]